MLPNGRVAPWYVAYLILGLLTSGTALTARLTPRLLAWSRRGC